MLENTMGALFAGTIIASILYGTTCIQAYHYLTTYPNDKWFLRAVVIVTWITDTIQQTLICVAMWSWLITHFGDFDEAAKILPTNSLELIFNGITGLLVKSFFKFRIWTLSGRNMWLTSAIALAILGEFCVTFTIGVIAVHLTFFAQLAPYRVLSSLTVGLSALTDVAIAISLCVLLSRRRQTSLKRTQILLQKLLLFSLTTGLLTSICALASLITLLASPQTLWFIGVYHILGRLYTNSLLATLNARRNIGQRGASDIHPSQIPHVELNHRSRGKTPMPKSELSVVIHTETSQDSDGDIKYPTEMKIQPALEPTCSR